MIKKLIMLGSIFFLIAGMLLLNNLHDTSFQILNPVSDVESEELCSSLEELERLEFSCLLCNDIRVPLDDAEKTFYISVDMENEEWEKLEFSSGQSEFQILFPENITENDKKSVIAEGKKFPMLVYNETQWAMYYITFSGLPLIDIETNEGFYNENITGSVIFYDTDFTSNGVVESGYYGHLRGNTSRMYPKKGYKLNLTKDTVSQTTVSNKESLFGMRKDNDWILYAMYNDESKIRDSLSIQIWNLFGAKAVSKRSTYGTNLTYVELFADNRYCGLYGLMEPIDSKQLSLKSGDYLYKRKNPAVLNAEIFAQAKDPQEEVLGFEIKEGTLNENSWEPLKELAELVTMPREQLQSMDTELVDTDNAMRMWLFLQIITGHDQTAKNMYYVAKYQEDGYKFYFAPWDMDLTWGNVSVGETNPLFTAFEPETVDDRVYWETGDWLIDLNYQGTKDDVQKLYEELRSTVLTDEAVEQMILETDSLIRDSGAYARDQERWPESAHTQDCGTLLEYAKERLNFLDKALADFGYFDD